MDRCCLKKIITKFFKETSKIDKERKAILVSTKVQGTIVCSEYYKPWCIYSKANLSQYESTLVSQLKDSSLYICASSIFANGSVLADSIVVKEAWTCNSSIGQQYYSAVLMKFKPVCYYCGLGGDGALVQDEEVTQLKKCYAFVAPICFLCKSKGKKPFCKMPCNVAKKIL